MSSKTALVMRATGAQGKGAVRHLISAGWTVRAFVTDASSERALALKTLEDSVELYQGSWKDPLSLQHAVQGCQALFLNQLPSFTDDAEIQEAKVVLDIAKKFDVKHIVFPSTVPLNNPNFREHLKDNAVAPAVVNKADVEELVKASGMTWTLLRPGFFMTNLLPPLIYWMYPEMKERKFVNSYGPDCVLGLVDPDDVGAFTAAAFEDPNTFGGRVATIVGQNMRVDDLVKELRNATGADIEVVYRTAEESEKCKSNPFIAGHLLCKELDHFVDMDEVQRWGVPLTKLHQFVAKHKDEFAQIASQGDGVHSEANKLPT